MKLTIPLGNKLTVGSGTKNFVPDAFSPLQLPNLLGWYDANDDTTLTEDTGRYSDWLDKSGNGNDLTQSTSGERPYTGRTIGGLTALDFRGAELIYRTDALGLTGTPALTIFALVEFDSVSNSDRYIAIGSDGVAGALLSIAADNSYRTNAANQLFPAGTTGTPTVVTTVRDAGIDMGDGRFRNNREELVEDSTVGTNPILTDDFLGIGAESSGLVAAADIAISEVIICNGYLSDELINKVESYLWQKYMNSLYQGLVDGAYAQEVLKTNPIRYYRMANDDSAGATEPDLAFGENDATHDVDSDYSINGPQKDIAKFSREFDGNEATSVPALTELNGSAVCSCSAWVFVTNQTADQAILAVQNGSVSGSDTITLWYNLSGITDNVCYTFLVGPAGAGANRVDSETDSALQGVWQHVVATMNGSSRKIYVDGILSNTNNSGTTTIATQTNVLDIGNWNATSWGMDGNIADLAIWDRELSDKEAANLFLSATRKNLITDPFDISVSPWVSGTGITVAASQSGSPDGTSTVSTISAGPTTSTSSARYMYFTTSPNVVYTYSSWIKANNSTTCTFACYEDSPGGFKAKMNVNLSNGTINSITGTELIDYGIEDADDGWYRCWITYTGSQTVQTDVRLLFYTNYQGSVADGDSIDVWNVQLIEGIGPPPPVLDPRYYNLP